MRKEYINGTEVKIHDVASAKQAKLLELKMLYNAKLKQGYESSVGIKVDCLPKNVSDFSQNLQYMELAGITKTLVMDFYNKAHVDVSYDDYKTICQELGAHLIHIRTLYWLERTKIMNFINFNKIKAYMPSLAG